MTYGYVIVQDVRKLRPICVAAMKALLFQWSHFYTVEQIMLYFESLRSCSAIICGGEVSIKCSNVFLLTGNLCHNNHLSKLTQTSCQTPS